MIKTLNHNLLVAMILGFMLSVILSGCGGAKRNNVGSPLQYIGSSDDKKNAIIETQIKNIQQQINVLENDFRKIEPSIQNLVAIESDIQTLITELSKLTDPAEPRPLLEEPTPLETNDSTNIPSQTVNEEVSTQAPTPLTQQGSQIDEKETNNLDFLNNIVDIRFGKFEAGTRIVVDFTPGSDINYDISKEEQDVVIDFGQTGWQASKDWTAKSSTGLILSYIAKQNPENAIMRIKTSGADMTVKVFTLPPATADKGPRLVLDFNSGIN